MLHSLKKWIINQHCLSCNTRNTEPFYHLCPICSHHIITIESLSNLCPICHDSWILEGICQNCSNQPQMWSHLHTIFSYRSLIKELYLLYKFQNSLLAEKDLISLLKEPLKIFQDYHFIVVPCGRETRKRLGFNPVTRILSRLALTYSEPLIKQHKGLSMKRLNAQERKFASNAMTLKNSLPQTQKKYMIVDDIFTTGNTLTQCILSLPEALHHRIEALCFLRS